MNIIKNSDFLSVTKDRHILLDTTVFIDASSSPVKFANIFNLETFITLVYRKAIETCGLYSFSN